MSYLHEKSNACIRNHTGFAMAAAVIPVPVADIGAITAVEIDMMRALTKIYGLNWSENIGKQALGIASAAMAGTGIWGSLIKFMPGVGSIVGGMIQMSVAGTVCYALGKTYQLHLETGGEVFNPEVFATKMKEYIKEGKNIVKELKKNVKNGEYDKR
ncbi:MAG: DUF697 domain-containing protein [Candidatus Cloacimonetes bacterium]|nr:DUF697 domain-containing protein [Candidatus Cloacimonadota bacterium]